LPRIRLACQTRVTGNTIVRRLVPDDEDEDLAVESMTDEFVEAAGEELQFSSPPGSPSGTWNIGRCCRRHA
jgi:hypothetical protein